MNVKNTEEFVLYQLIASKLGTMFTNATFDPSSGSQMEDAILDLVETVYKHGYVDGTRDVSKDLVKLEDTVKDNISRVFK